MANLLVVPVALTGFPGGPGTNTFHFRQGVDQFDDLHDFYALLGPYFPNSVSISIPGSGALVDEVTGELVSSWFIDPPAVVAGGSAEDYAGGVGATIRWDTAGVVNSRHVRGHTFVVPMRSGAFDTNGTIEETHRSALLDAAIFLQGAYGTDFVVWHRPVAGAGGSAHSVVGVGVPDRAAWLSSRRA